MLNEKLGIMEVNISHDISDRDSLRKVKTLKVFRYDLLSNFSSLRAG